MILCKEALEEWVLVLVHPRCLVSHFRLFPNARHERGRISELLVLNRDRSQKCALKAEN